MALTALIGPATKLIGKFIKDKDQTEKLAFELSAMAEKHATELAKGQLDINKEQAKHPSLFVSGARPAIMWVACLGLLWQFFIGPILTWFAVMFNPSITPPSLELEGLVTLVMSLLGLGAMRSYEKSKGIARDNLKK
tara:strand:+ start:663 stop:1073 length:411 start_codon:yes stop_codon:yes gene_type:complete